MYIYFNLDRNIVQVVHVEIVYARPVFDSNDESNNNSLETHVVHLRIRNRL